MKQPQRPGWMDGWRYLTRNWRAKWEKYGGRICTIAGTGGMILTGAHSNRKTYKIHEELRENGRRISEAREEREGEKKIVRMARIVKETGKCVIRTSRHYVGDGIAAGISGYAIHKGWDKEHTHYQQAAAMVGIMAADFMNYRKNVIAELGEDADRRYLTSKQKKEIKEALTKGEKAEETDSGEGGNDLVINLNENMLRIYYSKATTPKVWSSSHVIRLNQLEKIRNSLDYQLMYCGHFSVNDVRREFYGPKGDTGVGGLYGRVWEPGNPEHPEYGARVNLHYEEDEDFMLGLKDSCWIIIDIDPEPLLERLDMKYEKDPESQFTPVEDV